MVKPIKRCIFVLCFFSLSLLSLYFLSLSFLLLSMAIPAAADEDDMQQLAELFPSGRHLLELNYTSVDTIDGDQDIWLPRYTYAYSTSLRFSGSIGVATADKDSIKRGPTDSVLLLQYDPSAQLTANAFVPDTVGLTFGLQIPTGDHSDGLGEDLWAAQLGAGWLVDFPLDFWLLPSIQHDWSFREGRDTASRQRTDIGLGLYWLFAFKGWLGIEPVIAYDHKLEDSGLDWSVVAGKAWSTGWGLELRWSSKDRIDERDIRDDSIFLLGLTYQFGRPPKDSQ